MKVEIVHEGVFVKHGKISAATKACRGLKLIRMEEQQEVLKVFDTSNQKLNKWHGNKNEQPNYSS
jgi:hypothetical protein